MFLLLLEQFKLISYAPYRLERPFVGYALKLFSESLYVNVNGSRISEIVKSPYLVEKLIAREYSVVV